ncbi:ATP-binding cassette domain-containing protein [Coleofasciculus sp. H7-2]|uniref:ATP-binding cassette domain-containing protein n=1 Tax=Coleofasciculus sp. H7-2 TaxID=3351545 RepID=UPI00366EB8A1
MNIIELKQVSKEFRKGFQQTSILQDINLIVQRGEFVVLRGENGAGKTTLLNLILGLLKPSSGEVELMGLSPQSANSKIHVGVVLQDTQVPRNVKVKELIELLRSYYPNPLSTEEILNIVKLKDKESAWATDLSGGQKQRLYFALALAGNPDLLILDEPTRNLDEKGYEEFWQQIKLCCQRGITILMVTNNKSDWNELNTLATRCVTLHKITEIHPEGQLTQELINLKDKALEDQPENPRETENLPETSSQNIQRIFQQQLWFEILQLLRTPVFLIATLALVGFVPLLKLQGLKGKGATEIVIYLCGIILFTIVIDRLGKRIAVELSEKWLKLLRATPLPPTVYMAAKIATSLLICTVSLLLIFALGSWQLEMRMDLTQGLALISSLILGIVPFAILGLALGYLLDPKSADSILSLSLIVIPVACGSIPLPGPQIVQDLIACSPFYHYQELVLSAVSLKHDNQLFLHLLWLIWAGGAFGLFAAWSYQRDRVVQ